MEMDNLNAAHIAFYIKEEMERKRKVTNAVEVVMARLNCGNFKEIDDTIVVDNIFMGYRLIGGRYTGNSYDYDVKDKMFNEFYNILASAMDSTKVSVELKDFVQGVFIIKVTFGKAE